MGLEQILASHPIEPMLSASALCVAGSPAVAVPLCRRLGATCFGTAPSLLHRVSALLPRYGVTTPRGGVG